MRLHPLTHRRRLVLLWAGLWLAYGLWTWRAGVRSGDDTDLFSHWADALIAQRFNVPSFLREQDLYIPPTLYIGWIVLVAVIKSIAGAAWMPAIVFLNWLSFGAGSYAILAAIRRITASIGPLLLAAALFVAAGDLLIFMPFVLSDLIFWGLAAVTLAAGVGLAAAPEGDRVAPAAILGSLLVAAAFIFRPAGLPLLTFWIVALATAFARGPFDRFATGIVAAAVVLSLAALAWHAAIVIGATSWPFERLPEILAMQARQYQSGLLVFITPESHLGVEPAVTWSGAMRLTAQKIFYFMTPWLPSYSRAHVLINVVFFLPAYGLSIVALMSGRRLAPPQRRTVTMLALFVLGVVIFHVMLPLDYDHRYRLPILPALIILAAIGLESLRRPASQDAINAARGLV